MELIRKIIRQHLNEMFDLSDTQAILHKYASELAVD